MGKRRFLILAGLLLLLAAAGAWTWWAYRPPPVLVRQVPPPALAEMWPADRFWRWEFQLPPSEPGLILQIVVRQKTSPRGDPKTSKALTTALIPRAEATRSFDAGHFDLSRLSPYLNGDRRVGAATIQLLDLSSVGIVPMSSATQPTAPLRLMGTLRIGGALLRLSHSATVLPGEQIDAWNPHSDGAWINGELHLMNFRTIGSDGEHEFSVLLECAKPSYLRN